LACPLQEVTASADKLTPCQRSVFKPAGLRPQLSSCSGAECWSREPLRPSSALHIERRKEVASMPAAGGDSQRRQIKLLKKLNRGMDKPMGLWPQLCSCNDADCCSREPLRPSSALRIEWCCGRFGTPAAGGDSQRRQVRVFKATRRSGGWRCWTPRGCGIARDTVVAVYRSNPRPTVAAAGSGDRSGE